MTVVLSIEFEIRVLFKVVYKYFFIQYSKQLRKSKMENTIIDIYFHQTVICVTSDKMWPHFYGENFVCYFIIRSDLDCLYVEYFVLMSIRKWPLSRKFVLINWYQHYFYTII